MTRQVFLDTETTGLSAEGGDRIIEIGCVELVQRKLTGNNKHFYLNPDRESHAEALAVHGISNEFLRDKPRFHEVADELLEYLAGAEIIIHNAPFDVGFLNKELELIGRPGIRTIISGVVDSLALAKEMFPGKRNSLDALCTRLEVDNSGRTLHGALLDAELLADVYINMTRGQDALIVDMAPAPEPGQQQVVRIDLRQFTLPVLMATEQEQSAHEAVLAQLDKAAGSAVWRKLEKPVA